MKLVVIDDSPDFLGLAEYLLRKALPECRVTRFDPNAIGLPDAGHGFEEYDLILLDAELGASGSGVDWLCNACETPGFPPVIVLTASRDPYLAARAIKVGAADYLVKADMKPERLAQVICDALGQGSERSTTVQRSGRQGLATGATRAGNRSHASRTRSASTRAASSSPAEEETLVLDEPLADIEEPPQEVSVRGYRIAEELGKGATARVFRAERESDGQEIVLKVVTPELLNEAELLERFLQEAELVVDIDSRHVVKIYEQAFTDDGGFIAMEYLPGGDLRCLLDGPLPEPIAVDYLRQILLGLEAIHAVGIVHRDMKPENVMLRADGSLALVDFGISKRADLHQSGRLTVSGSILGTPYYMSPEQAHGLKVDAGVDLYAAGVIFYEMLLGKRPFTGKSAAQILYAHAYGERPVLSGRLARYQDVLQRLIAIDRRERFDSAAQALMELEALRARRR